MKQNKNKQQNSWIQLTTASQVSVTVHCWVSGASPNDYKIDLALQESITLYIANLKNIKSQNIQYCYWINTAFAPSENQTVIAGAICMSKSKISINGFY